MARSAFFVLLMLLTAISCRKETARLDEVQKMAYAVKPAVVRISALATAEFRYRASVVEKLEAHFAREESRPVVHRPVDARADYLVVETGAGGSGSGFVVHPDGFILTNGHVVAPTRERNALEEELRRNGAIAALVRHFSLDALRRLHDSTSLERYVAALAAAGELANVRIVNQVELSNGETLPYRVRRYSPALHELGSDLAVIQVGRGNLPSLLLGSSESARVGESIWSVGYPAVASSSDDVIGGWLSRESDLEATFNPGIITALKRNVNDAPVLQSNVAIYRGNSGGPAVNQRGEVIGISTWGHTSAEQIKFLVPIDVAKQMLAEAGIPTGVSGEFDTHYRAALDAAQGGNWRTAKAELVQAVRFFPGSPDVTRLTGDVERAIQAMPSRRLGPLPLAIAAGVVLMVITTAAFVTRRPANAALRGAGFPVREVTPEAPVAGIPSREGELGRLTILNGDRAGEKLRLGGSGIRIGRESAICEIVLENPKISRLHAEVVSVDGRVLLIDRNSSNGTYVNDRKIDKRYLEDGDIIHFGGRSAIAVAFHA
jgi:serine protease Do